MENPKSSDLLQARLRERKAENARANKYRPQHTPGRDDAIFDAEPHSPKANMSKHYQTPPADSARLQSSKPGSRRGSNMGASRDTPRALGVREMEEHVDKLSKQNFDLKLEVFHRRERIDELEKQLKQQAHVAEENAELLQINEELVLQLERRDVAVDEAVVQICDLEEKVRSLQEQLTHRKQPSTYRRITGSEDLEPLVNRRESKSRPKTASPKKVKESSRTKVSPEVSARMATLATTPEKAVKAIQPPAFLQDNQPTTLALRSLFVDGDKSIRPIPSYASLLSRQTALDEEELQNEVLRSPSFSVVSDSDLRSIYGPDHDDVYPKRTANETLPDQTPKGMPPSEASRQRKLARVNRWVEDAAMTPAAPARLKRTPKALNSDQFQSLGGVLHQGGGHIKAEPQAAARNMNSESLTVTQTAKPRRTPPMPALPVFGQNYFPPTPDTMITNTLSHSSSSINQESRKIEAAAVPPRNFGPQLSVNQRPILVNPETRPAAIPHQSFLPQELDSYGDADFSDGNDPYLPNTYASDESTSLGSPQQPTQSPTRSSPGPEQLFKSRRRPAPIVSSPSVDLPPVLRVSTDGRGGSRTIQSSQSSPYSSPGAPFPLFTPADTGRSLAESTSLLPKTPPKLAEPQYANNIPRYRSQSQTHQTYPINTNQQFPTSPTAIYTNASSTSAPTKSPPSAFLQRSNSLRTRVAARLTRRGSTSTPASFATATGEPSPALSGSFSGALSGPEDQPARKRSIRQRFFQRRSSSAHAATVGGSGGSADFVHAPTASSRASHDYSPPAARFEPLHHQQNHQQHHHPQYLQQQRDYITTPTTAYPAPQQPTHPGATSSTSTKSSARLFTPTTTTSTASSADESSASAGASNAYAHATPTPTPTSRPARGRSPPPPSQQPQPRPHAHGRSGSGLAVSRAGPGGRRPATGGSGSETEGESGGGAGFFGEQAQGGQLAWLQGQQQLQQGHQQQGHQQRQRSRSLRLRDVDGTGAGRRMK